MQNLLKKTNHLILITRCLLIEANDFIRKIGLDGNLKALEDWMANASRRLPKDDPLKWVNPNWIVADGGKSNEDDAMVYMNKVFEHWCKMDGIDLPEGSRSMPEETDNLVKDASPEKEKPAKKSRIK
jgi:hypothetical protein